jgi:hypothetical protein
MASHTTARKPRLPMSRIPHDDQLTVTRSSSRSPAVNAAGRKKGNSGTGHGNRYLARVLGEAAVGARHTDTCLGERYRSIARRRANDRGCRPIDPDDRLALRTDPDAPFIDLGPGYTTPAPTSTGAYATTSVNSRTSATRSPSKPPPDDPHHGSQDHQNLRIGPGPTPATVGVNHPAVAAARDAHHQRLVRGFPLLGTGTRLSVLDAHVACLRLVRTLDWDLEAWMIANTPVLSTLPSRP